MRNLSGISGRFLGCLLLVSALALTVGCGGPKGKVSGKVYYKGKALTAGTVQFFPEGKGGNFSSAIGQDGSYSIDKLPAGKARIAVISNTTNPMQTMNPMAGRGAAQKGMKTAAEEAKKGGAGGDVSDKGFDTKGGFKLPDQFGDPEKSGLHCDVTGSTQEFDIKID
jgi:hypothetical protein